MQASQSKRYLVYGVLLAVLLLVCGVVYGQRSKTLPPAPAGNSVHFTDAAVLHDWMPQEVYNDTITYLSYYLATNNIPGTALTVTTRPTITNHQVAFTFVNDADTQKSYDVSVKSSNYGGLLASTVYINQIQQDITAAQTIYTDSFSGFDTLADDGLSGSQIYAMQQALYRFAPKGSGIALDTTSITQSLYGNTTYTSFSIAINGQTYAARNVSTNLGNINLVVSLNKKQVLNTGTLTVGL